MNKLFPSIAALTRLAMTRRLGVAAVLLAAGISLPAFAGPFIYVGNTGEDTVSKIDVNSNQEVARYGTWFTPGSLNHVAPRGGNFTQGGPCPSRIVHDASNFYVLDRFFPCVFTQSPPTTTVYSHLPVLLKIGLTGGTPTSTGSTALPIVDANATSNPSNDNIDPGEATDKLIQWAKPIGTVGQDEGKLGRALCIDTKGFLWVGMYDTEQYYKVDPATGATIAGPIKIPGHKPYGCQVDTNGKLWSIDGNTTTTLAEIDTNTDTWTPPVHTHTGSHYSVAVSNDCSTVPSKVKVYLSERGVGGTYIAYDPLAPPASAFTTPVPKFNSWAVAVDSKGNILSGEFSPTGRVIKTSPTGAVLWDTTPPAAQQVQDLHGLIVDDNDNVWVVDLQKGRVIKYDGSNGQYLAEVKVGKLPYTYGNPPPPTCVNIATPTPTATVSPTPIPACAQVTAKEIRCLPDGGYSYTFNVTNNSGAAMSQVLLTPVTEGSFTLAPQLSNPASTLASGQSTTITTNIGHVKPGEKVCFFVSLLADNAPCCVVQVCPTLPECRESSTPKPSPTRQRR